VQGCGGYSLIWAIYLGEAPKGIDFAHLVSNRLWFLHSSLELGMLFTNSYFFIIINKAIDKSLSLCL